MLKRLYSVVLGGLMAVSPMALPVSDQTTETTQIENISLQITRQGANVVIEPSGELPGQTLTISRGGVPLEPSSDGNVHDSTSSSPDRFYTVEIDQPAEPSSDSTLASSQSETSTPTALTDIRISTIPIPQPAYPMETAVAATPLPSRTRFRYQTFIVDKTVSAPSWVCAPPSYDSYVVIGSFLGDDRSWDPDSNSFRTRTDALIDWGNGGDITSTHTVGMSTQILDIYYFLTHEHIEKQLRASSDKLTLVQAVKSPQYVSFHINSDVENPFCVPGLARGIWYDLAFFVAQSGAYTVTGTIREVPNHELYARDSINPSWQFLMHKANYGFECLAPYANDCKNPIPATTGDLIP
jgi:hypothetical protein